MSPGEAAALLRLHLSEGDTHGGKPLYELIVQKCRELGVAGATVFRGLEGYGETSEIHRRRLVRHDQPIVVTIVDQPATVERLIQAVEGMMDTGLIVVSKVVAIRVQKTNGAPPARGA